VRCDSHALADVQTAAIVTKCFKQKVSSDGTNLPLDGDKIADGDECSRRELRSDKLQREGTALLVMFPGRAGLIQ